MQTRQSQYLDCVQKLRILKISRTNGVEVKNLSFSDARDRKTCTGYFKSTKLEIEFEI